MVSHDSRLKVENLGPIRLADVDFGDLTVLVGPQATGKSIFLQLLKLMLDPRPIFATFKKYGLEWDRKSDEFFDLYFGEGMRRIWTPGSSRITWHGKPIDIDSFVAPKQGRAEERSFFIPAQRVLALSRDGWLRPFSEYKPGDPYTVRDFSEKLRTLMDSGMGRGEALFPQAGRLKAEIRTLLEDAIFPGFALKTERHGPQKRLVLSGKGVLSGEKRDETLPFMVWSAGQREFVPLLLGLYWLMPPTKISRRGSIQWVMIEELEMGLHPKAISVMLLIILDLLSRGYKVCLSTHSPHVLDLVWALGVFRRNGARAGDVLRLFGAKQTQSMLQVAKVAVEKSTRVWYFDPKTHKVRDISGLDPGSANADEAEWGGLTEFSGRVAEEVARVVAEAR